jgi:hypothetical protein
MIIRRPTHGWAGKRRGHRASGSTTGLDRFRVDAGTLRRGERDRRRAFELHGIPPVRWRYRVFTIAVLLLIPSRAPAQMVITAGDDVSLHLGVLARFDTRIMPRAAVDQQECTLQLQLFSY